MRHDRCDPYAIVEDRLLHEGTEVFGDAATRHQAEVSAMNGRSLRSSLVASTAAIETLPITDAIEARPYR
jgi:hypothetical protein